MHCLGSATLSECMSTIFLDDNIVLKNGKSLSVSYDYDDNEKLPINEVLDVLIGTGTFTSRSSFYTLKASNLLQ